jgi:hypothetical protein
MQKATNLSLKPTPYNLWHIHIYTGRMQTNIKTKYQEK